MSHASHDEPVAAEPFADAAQAGKTSFEPRSRLLEFGTAARTPELHAEHHQDRGRPIRAWSSRRAGARARREFMEQAIAAALSELRQAAPAAVTPLPDPVEAADWHDTMELPAIAEPEPLKVVALPPVQAEEPEPDVEPEPDEDAEELAAESPATALLARIGAYTVSSR